MSSAMIMQRRRKRTTDACHSVVNLLFGIDSVQGCIWEILAKERAK